VIISDCQAVVSAFRRPHLHQGYKAKFGGLWREKGLSAVGEVIKTPAHRTKEEAIAQDDEDDWYGNDRADFFAKRALAGTGKDGSDYKVARKINLNSLAEVSAKLADHLHTIAIATVPKVRTGAGKSRISRSEHQFISHLNRWVCLKCGCTKKGRKSRQDRTSCVERSRIHGNIHGTHRIFCGQYELDKGIPNFTFCVSCGCYASQQAVGLKLVCKGSQACKSTIRNRLGLKQHPITKKPIWGIHRVVSTSDTKQLLDSVSAIVNRHLPSPNRLETGRAPPPERMSGTCLSEASFGEQSFFGLEEDDPFLDIAYS
jgi:hypothetical protein